MDCKDKRHGYCGNCGKKLKGRQREWCSKKCYREFVSEHRWTQAKTKAKKPVTYYLCAHAGNWIWDGALGFQGEHSDDCHVFTTKPEVNHKDPCLGRHKQWGCHHHSDNLEVLCHPCHVKETARQRAEGLFE